MSYTSAWQSSLGSVPITSADYLDGDAMFTPKWGVILVALAIFAMAASYDAQLGLAVGIVLVVIAAVALWIWARFAMQPGESKADQSRLSRRFQKLGRNRRAAQAEEAELRAQPRSDPGKRS